MKNITKNYGWIGKILRVDLTTGQITSMNTMNYAEGYIGGRGIATRIAWEEIDPDVDAFDPENLLIIMTGPLTGTLAPSSGRVMFCGVASQVYPKPWFTRSCMGGWFGSELKYSGFDGIIVQGKAEKPAYIWINDGDIEILDAGDIWGRDTFSTQKYLGNKHGEEVKNACIGPAGENLVRLAVIQSETGNAAGQGGFGAVMGSKNLKAVVAKGTGVINIAEPDDFLEICMALNKDFQRSPQERPPAFEDPEDARRYGRRGAACSHACPWKCGCIWRNVPGRAYPSVNTTLLMCVARLIDRSIRKNNIIQVWNRLWQIL